MGLFGKDKKKKSHSSKKAGQRRFDFLGLDDEYEDEDYEEEEEYEYGEEYEYEEEEPLYEDEEGNLYYKDENGEFVYIDEQEADSVEEIELLEDLPEETEADEFETEFEPEAVEEYDTEEYDTEEYDTEEYDTEEYDAKEYEDEYEEDYEEDYEESVKGSKKKKKRKDNPLVLAFDKFKELPVMDKILVVTGAAVLFVAILTGSIYMGVRNVDNAVASFAEVGTELENITVIGESGLLAVNNAQIAKLSQIEETEEVVEEKGSAVGIKLTTIVKDLKIKFINPESDKLIANIPFEVEIATPSGKTETWKDDDMDGVIYKENIEGGTYKVTLTDLSKEYPEYSFAATTESIEVLKTIAYKKVDVVEEIKTEAEVNAAVEDTAVAEVVEESKLTDTVPFVASTSTAGAAGYVSVSKSTIKNPGETAKLDLRSFYLMAREILKETTESKVSVSPETASLKIGETTKITPTLTTTTTTTVSENDAETTETTDTDASEAASWTWSSSDTGVATVENGTVKAIKAGTATITATANEQSATCVVTVTGEESALTLDKTSLTVGTGLTATITATVKPAEATITAKSAEEAVATVSVNGKTVTVKGVKVGTSKITVTGSNGKTAECTVTVTNSLESDTTSLLKDKDGNQVFVKDGDNYRKAVFADYYKTDQFFIETTQTLYTGWQTINGKTYYYLSNHNYVTGEQVIQGAKYTFASDGSMVTSSGTMGIDVSKWNGSINWESVKNSGVSYAIIRCGYRGSSTGALITDPTFATNISKANAAGIKTGVYFFTQAVNEKEAVEEASMVLSLVSKYKISYPIFLDVESSGGRADGIDKATRTAVCKAFCATIQNSGYTAGVYANKTWLNSKIDAGSLGAYKIWLAQYAAAPTYTGRYNLWQYSSKGSIGGISGNVDLNISYLGY